MKRQVWLAVTAEPQAFAPLVEALAAEGLRAGWLEQGAAEPLPERLAAAAAAGVLRAVAVGAGRVVVVKPVRGAPAPAALAREHFKGCRVVLVRDPERLPRLEPEDGFWRLVRPSGGSVRWSTAELVRALGRPSRWSPS